MKTWTHEFQIDKDELDKELSTYIFKYIIGFSSGLITNRVIERTENPLRFKCTYTFI